MSAERVIANNLHIAREDLEGARLLAKANNRNAAYLCEQAAEKIIRAVLTSEGLHAGIGHALGQMVAQLPNENTLKAELSLLAPLAAFATTYRYPTSSRVPSPPGEAELRAHLSSSSESSVVRVRRLGSTSRLLEPPRLGRNRRADCATQSG
jgi:HEPN domain-containing protein